MNKNIFRLKMLWCVVLAAMLGAGTNASAQIITNSYDVGSNYIDAGNFFTGDNLGFGFGPWTISEGGGGQSLRANDNAQFGQYSFTLTNAIAAGVTTANRPFSNPLPVGGSFSVRFRLEHLDNSGFTNGFQLQDAAGNVVFSFYHQGGDNANGWYTDASGSGVATNFTYNFQGFSSLTFTLNSASTYTFKDNGPGSGVFSGTLSGGPITQVTFFRANTNAAPSDGQVFSVNALAITTLGSKPVFTVQPKNTAAVAGGTVTLNTSATSNLGEPNYQWFFTNGPIAGATSTNLTLTNVGLSDAGNYYAIATNTAGASTSSVVVVTIIPFGYTNANDVASSYSAFTGNQGFGFGPWVLSTPGGGSYINGNPSLFAIWNGAASGVSTAVRPFNSPLPVGGSFLVQLQMNGMESGSTNGFELQDASGNVLFSYWHEGGDAELGNGHYSDAGVTGGTATNFWYHFQQVDSFAFTLNSPTTYTFTDLTSGASLTGTISGEPITQVTFVRANLAGGTQPPNGQDLKFNALMILSPTGTPPQFTVQPQYNGGLPGSTINLSGTAISGVGSVGYQWYFNGAPITGATSSALVLGNATLENSGNYFLVATNAFGSITSKVSMVTVYVEQDRLFAYEGFEYTGGFSAIDGTLQAGGLGWDGAWQIVAGVNNFIADGSLIGDVNVPPGYDSLSMGNSYYNFDQSRAGRWLDCSTNSALAARGYVDANGFIGMPGKTIYVSFLIQSSVPEKFYEFEFHRADLNDPGRIAGVGNDTDTTDVNLRTPGAPFSSLGAGDAAVNFYVVRIDFHGGNDDVRVYRNPTSLTEPPTPTVSLTNVGNMAFNGISLGAYGNYLAADEIRVGATWSDALGMAAANRMMSPVKQGNTWNVRFAGNPAFTYRILRATSLTGEWTEIGTTTPAENGIGIITDPNPPEGAAFYRTITP